MKIIKPNQQQLTILETFQIAAQKTDKTTLEKKRKLLTNKEMIINSVWWKTFKLRVAKKKTELKIN